MKLHTQQQLDVFENKEKNITTGEISPKIISNLLKVASNINREISNNPSGKEGLQAGFEKGSQIRALGRIPRIINILERAQKGFFLKKEAKDLREILKKFETKFIEKQTIDVFTFTRILKVLETIEKKK